VALRRGILLATACLTATCGIAPAAPTVPTVPTVSTVSTTRKLEQAALGVIARERAQHRVPALRASPRLQPIAEHRARLSRARGKVYPGRDVVVDLKAAHVCFRRAREWEFGFEGATPAAVRHYVGYFLASDREFRGDLLMARWRRVGVGIAVGRPFTWLIVDLVAPC
jgi:hypothetical protein